MKNNTKKQDILKTYAQVIEKQGVEGASLGAVARQMGINQSLIFHYFENKEDMTCQLTEHVCQRCVKSYERAFPKDDSLTAEAFEAFVGYILEIHQNRRRSVSPKLYFALTYLLPRQPQVKASFARLTDTLVELLARELNRFRAAGVIAATDAPMAARTLLCLADGILCYDELTPPRLRTAFIAAQKQLFLESVGFVAPAHPPESAELPPRISCL
jgi:AcrR family transcriptional regulator